MMHSRLAVGTLALAIVGFSWSPLAAQNRDLEQLKPLMPSGDIVAPYFDGWYANPDGSFTLSFGYMNRNTAEIVEIPLGENNFIEPAQFNGMQPTHFRPVQYGGFSGRRERGVFTVTIPAEFRDRDVVWTLTHAGQTHSVPGRVTAPAYQLGYTPMAAGSLPPTVRFDENGPVGQARTGIVHGPLRTSVGSPLKIDIWAQDQGEREDRFPVNMTWQKHQGPGTVTFEPVTARLEGMIGQGTTNATFSEPGEYLLRVRVDNFTASDSSFGNQCCWTNGYVRVNVTP